MKRKVRRKRRKFVRSRECAFCKQNTVPDYKDVDTLRHYISERGKIFGRGFSGVCQKHQKILGRSIKRARFLALLPFVVRPK